MSPIFAVSPRHQVAIANPSVLGVSPNYWDRICTATALVPAVPADRWCICTATSAIFTVASVGQLVHIAAPFVFVFVLVSVSVFVFVFVSTVRRLFTMPILGLPLGLLAVTVALLAFTLGLAVRLAFGLSCKSTGKTKA